MVAFWLRILTQKPGPSKKNLILTGGHESHCADRVIVNVHSTRRRGVCDKEPRRTGGQSIPRSWRHSGLDFCFLGEWDGSVTPPTHTTCFYSQFLSTMFEYFRVFSTFLNIFSTILNISQPLSSLTTYININPLSTILESHRPFSSPTTHFLPIFAYFTHNYFHVWIQN
jgi:hypothetical protein